MKNIMLVDDTRFMRNVLKDILMPEGYQIVSEASSGEEALAHYQKHKPDIVTLDITMPGMNGIQTLKALLAIDPQVKVCMISAMGQHEFIKEAFQLGAKDFIIKPFQADEILKTFKHLSIPHK